MGQRYDYSEMKKLKNASYIGSAGRESLLDLIVPENWNGKIILFIHGYMGFKDWGAWNLMEEYFVSHNLGFCKFNMSHNGGTCEQAIDFPDLEAFANNRYSYELQDVYTVIAYLKKEVKDIKQLILVGHSRGGGIALLQAKHPDVHALVTLAAISSVEKRFSDQEMLEKWRETGVRFVDNQRTKQAMPHAYVQVEDFVAHKARLDIESHCKAIEKPLLIFHGDADSSVSLEEGREIATWTGKPLHIQEGADHVFGASQPWLSKQLPEKLEEICTGILRFVEDLN